jgi:phosphatidylinositol alpha-mannosyltransferase
MKKSTNRLSKSTAKGATAKSARGLTIGFVLDDTLDTPDGVQQYILTLGAWLSAQGHTVHYLVGETKRTDIPNVHSLSRNVQVRFNGNRMSIPMAASSRQIKQLLKDVRFDALHIQMPYSPFMSGKVLRYADPTTAVIGTFHIAPYGQKVILANRLLAILLRRSQKRFDSVVSVSPAAQEFARMTYGITSTIVPNVVEVARFKGAKPMYAEKTIVQIMFLGRLVPRKGCDVLLQAIDKLVQRTDIRPFHVYIGGRGPLEANLRAYVAKQRLEKYITFTGYVAEGDKPSFYASADIAVFPSMGGESFGIVLVEAMSTSRTLVLGGDNPGYRGVLGGRAELLFPTNNPYVLADLLATYMQNPIERQELITWQNKELAQYDVAVVGTKLVKEYNQALHQRTNVQ